MDHHILHCRFKPYKKNDGKEQYQNCGGVIEIKASSTVGGETSKVFSATLVENTLNCPSSAVVMTYIHPVPEL